MAVTVKMPVVRLMGAISSVSYRWCSAKVGIVMHLKPSEANVWQVPKHYTLTSPAETRTTVLTGAWTNGKRGRGWRIPKEQI